MIVTKKKKLVKISRNQLQWMVTKLPQLTMMAWKIRQMGKKRRTNAKRTRKSDSFFLYVVGAL